jgi:cytochrome c oxidase cbb3-type subunit 1
MNRSDHPSASPSAANAPGSAAPIGAAPEAARVSAAEIDSSCRWPLLLLFTHAVLWLVLALFLQCVVAIKLHSAGFLADCPWLTLGRLRPAAMNAFLYGFASQAGFGVLLWMFCRLGGVRLVLQWPLIVAGKLWNIGVAVGFIAILVGASTGFEWLEMPRAASALLFVALALFGICAMTQFTRRQQGELYPSQWFLLAGLFWFAWSYSAANYLLVVEPVRGTFQAAVNAWFTGNFLGLWLTPVALAALFYFVPRLTGQALFSRELALFAFWTQLGFGGFAGLASLLTSPVPRWMGAAGTAATVGLLLPLGINVLNWYRTQQGNPQARKQDFVLRFVLFGALCYVGHGLLNALYATPQVNAVVAFTYAGVGKTYLALYGFVAMVLFGCIYYIVPRVTQVNWPKEGWIQMHWMCSLLGVALVVIPLTIGGVLQGLRLLNPEVPFVSATGTSVVKGTIMFIGMSTLGVFLLFLGQLVFLANFAQLLRGLLQPMVQLFCAECCGSVPDAKAEGKP